MTRPVTGAVAALASAILCGASFGGAEPADVIRPCAADARGDRVCALAKAVPLPPGKYRATGPNELLVDTLADAAHDAGAYWDVTLDQTAPAPVTISMDGFVEKSDGNGLCCLYVDVHLTDGTALYTNVAPVDRLISAGWNTATVTINTPKPIRALRAYALLRRTATRARFRPPRVHVADARELRFDGLPVAPLASPLAEGFYLRDVAAKSGFAPVAGGQAAKGVRLAATCERRGAARLFDVTLSVAEKRDRALTLAYAVPLPDGDLVWHDNARTARELAADGLEASVAKDWSICAGGLSRCPFGAVSAGERGVAVGIDNSAPAYFRTVANPKLRVLFIAFDVGLAPEKPEAHFRFCTFPFDGRHGFRGALEAHRALFPDDYRVRIRRHGQWMAFMKIADVPHWEDFGFRIMEGTEALAWDDAHDMLTFRYTEPGTWWVKMQPKAGKATVTRDDAIDEVKARAARGDAYARAWESSVTRDANGSPGGRAIDTPWCKGYVWSYNSAPGVSGEVTDFKNKVGDAALRREYADAPPPKGLDGEYVDSADLYCTATADYDRRHFAAARTPLCFDLSGRPVVFKGLACYEYVRSLADRLWPKGRFVMVNSAPRDWCWLMPYADVGGDEVNWMRPDGWKPPAEDFLLYKLAAGCGKPMNFLMNTPRKNLTREHVEAYMKRMLAYGFMPGLNGKTDGCHYYSDKGLLDRDRDLHRKYVPLCRRVSEAGWRPVNRLTDPVARPVVVEQFGDSLLTVLNDAAKSETVRLKLKAPCETVCDLVSGRRLAPQKDGTVTFALGAQDVAVLELKRPGDAQAAANAALVSRLRLTKMAWRKGDSLFVDVPAGTNRSAHGSIPLDLAKFDGKGVCASVRVRGWRLTPTVQSWEGFKFMMPYVDEATDTPVYPGTRQILGDFDWKTVLVTDANTAARRRRGSLTLGIQSGTGRLEFDLSSLKVEAMPRLWPVTNETLRCAYTERVRNAPVRRGVMLGHGLKEKDFADLEAWGVTLARFQMTRQWNTVGGNRDLADYDRYIDGCLDDLENHLAWARRHGIQIVVDLHAAPGSRDERHDEHMFHDPVYAEHFIKTWRRIATRFKGRPEIFAFDLVNEPQQTTEAAPGCDYWTLQSRAAEAIREIDPETPIMIESNMYDPPTTFSYMMPLNLTNVIYQSHMYVPGDYTHQGVHDRKGPVVAYPSAKCDKAYLRKALQPVRDFQLRHGARIYVGEFSAIVWAPGAGDYIRDCIDIFEDYGWDWTFHAFREWDGWSVEHEATPETRRPVPSKDNPRKRALLEGFRRGQKK